ncbi:MAG: hypothetical protein J0M11_06520 [Anaerolineae bacterium]|nr:hypothetical protein [Anaerolineae bacterium]
MRPSISEFSYGYALTEAFSGLGDLSAAPIFPSLRQEGQQGGGYDVQIQYSGSVLFLQFKLSDCMVRDNALEAVNFGLPYFRMHIRSLIRSQQHPMLLGLEASGNTVFYAAPKFHTPEEFNTSYLNRTIIEDSFFIEPSTIGAITDYDDHYIAFNAANDHGFYSKEPKRLNVEKIGSKYFVHKVREEVKEKKKEMTQNDELNIRDEVIEVISHAIGQGFWKGLSRENLIADRRPILQAAYLARTFIGCEMLLLSER